MGSTEAIKNLAKKAQEFGVTMSQPGTYGPAIYELLQKSRDVSSCQSACSQISTSCGGAKRPQGAGYPSVSLGVSWCWLSHAAQAMTLLRQPALLL